MRTDDFIVGRKYFDKLHRDYVIFRGRKDTNGTEGLTFSTMRGLMFVVLREGAIEIFEDTSKDYYEA